MPYLDERQLDDLSSSGFPYYNCHTCTTSSPHILHTSVTHSSNRLLLSGSDYMQS